MSAKTPPGLGRPDPRAAYQALRADRAASVARWARRDAGIAASRMIVFLAGVVVAWQALPAHRLSPAWILAPLVLFAGLVIHHDRVLRALARTRRAVEFWDQGLARLDDRWAGQGASGERFRQRAHPYADDLDLFGVGSLFELLCGARTRAGEEALARWLAQPRASLAEIRARQAAVAELRDQLDLREELALAGADLRLGVDPDALRAWALAPGHVLASGWRWTAAGLSALTLAALIGWITQGAAFRPVFLVFFLLLGGLRLLIESRTRGVLKAVERPARDLRLLVSVIALIEKRRFAAPLLIDLQRALRGEGLSAAEALGRLARLVEIGDSRRNQLFIPIDFLLVVPLHLAHAIERWRARHGGRVVGWLAALGEIEALGSLAAYAFDRPRDSFPELSDERPRFVAEGLGHPLIPEARRVTNDVRLDEETRLLIVSGSNMSGKSVLLRAVGVNAALALAGAPVSAEHLRLSVLAVGATMRIHDSLRDGESHFYAEVLRVRDMMALASGPAPLLFLLDELLQGTNSHDRRIAAEAIVRAFLDRGAIGLISTHDLALADIADALGRRARNVHFQDELTDQGLKFDYRLRPGVVTRSNALSLMRSVGLDV